LPLSSPPSWTPHSKDGEYVGEKLLARSFSPGPSSRTFKKYYNKNNVFSKFLKKDRGAGEGKNFFQEVFPFPRKQKGESYG
jgi:hypothetical protein